MRHEQLDTVGRLLMKHVRDDAIQHCDMVRLKGERAHEIRRRLAEGGPEAERVLAEMIPEIVDAVLRSLLWAMDQQQELMLGLRDASGQITDVNALSDGLAGELYSSEGWIARFSKERATPWMFG